MRGAGRVVFAAIVLMLVGFLNIVYGFGALDDANYFAGDTGFVLDNLNALGWVLIILGVSSSPPVSRSWLGEPTGGCWAMIAGSLGALGALFSIGGANPWWSLSMFALCPTSSTASSSTERTSASLSRTRARRAAPGPDSVLPGRPARSCESGEPVEAPRTPLGRAVRFLAAPIAQLDRATPS